MEYLQKGKANVVIDGQWGSTGKGKVLGYIAKRSKIDVATCDFQTNAGHTFIDDDGKEYMVQQLPSSLINPNTVLCVNAGATITVEKILDEIKKFDVDRRRLFIHPMAGVVTQEDLENEKGLDRISSTKKGCGSSLSRKIMRVAKTAQDFEEFKPYIADTSEIVRNCLYSGGTVLVETAQGFDLSVNHGTKYPYTTSRDVTVGTALSNAGIPVSYLGNVWGSLRTFPIRVGNAYDKDGNMLGTSGPWHDDQEELTWDWITNNCGSPFNLEEKTTVTKKVRRIFTFSFKQLFRFIEFNHPTHLFINFVNYWNWDDAGQRESNQLSAISWKHINKIVHEMNDFCHSRKINPPKLSLLGTGRMDSDMVEL